MTTLTLRRLSGFAATAAGALCILGGLLHPIDHGQAHDAAALASSHGLGSAALLIGTVLLLVGLPGVYGGIAPRSGKLGLVGYLLYFVGNMLSAVPHLVLMAFAGHELAHHQELISDKDAILAAPAFEAEQIISGIGLILGLLVFSVALLRGRGVPRWPGIVGVVGAVLQLVPLPAMPVVTGLQIELLRGVLIIGLGLLTIRSTRSDTAAEYVESQPVAAA